MCDKSVVHAELRKRFCVLSIEQKGDQWEPCSTTRGPDAVTQEHQQSKRASQDRRECAATRTRMHSPTENYCDWKREAVRSCVLCCCRAVSFHASAKDRKGKVYFKDPPTNGHDRSQIPLNARSVWADFCVHSYASKAHCCKYKELHCWDRWGLIVA